MTAIDTDLVHAGEPDPRIGGALAMPIFQSATFAYEGEAEYDDLPYHRLSNRPNHAALHAKLAAIEGGEAALVTASGMAAITTSILSVVAAGDHLLAHDRLYGGTHTFLTRVLPRFGVEVDLVPFDDPDAWEAARKPNTKAIYVETITNPLLSVPDLGAVVNFARERGLVSMTDNTFATPVHFRAPEAGFDLSIHSATKYLAGHGDVIAGAVVGRADLVEGARRLLNVLGGSLDAHACFLLHRGLKTLGVRVRTQTETAGRLAEASRGANGVRRVHYPGLSDHPSHAAARAWLGGGGGVVSIELEGGEEAAARLVERLTLAVEAPSLGGVETLASRPGRLSHADLSPEERERAGIPEGLVRVAVGLEAADDLIADFERALG